MSGTQTGYAHRINARAAERAWMDRAACKGAGTVSFFDAADPGPALAICARCEVRDECAAYAAATRATGVWGGKLIYEPRDRRAKP